MRTVDECISILEIAEGEVSHVIPDDVLNDIIFYLEEYKILESNDSWERFPDRMGK